MAGTTMRKGSAHNNRAVRFGPELWAKWVARREAAETPQPQLTAGIAEFRALLQRSERIK